MLYESIRMILKNNLTGAYFYAILFPKLLALSLEVPLCSLADFLVIFQMPAIVLSGRTTRQVPYPGLSPLFATLTKTPGVGGYSSHFGTHPFASWRQGSFLFMHLRECILQPFCYQFHARMGGYPPDVPTFRSKRCQVTRVEIPNRQEGFASLPLYFITSCAGLRASGSRASGRRRRWSTRRGG